MSLDQQYREKILVLDISNASIFKKLKIKTIEDIFIKVGKLEKGCFSISEEHFSDGSYKLNFYYPTDMSDNTATELFDFLYIKLADMSLGDLENLLNNV